LNLDSSNPEQNEAAQRKPSKYVKDFEPNYHSKETAADEHNRKFFLTFCYFPKVCGPYINYIYRVQCERGFIKKKDSENHVAMEALKILYKNGHLDDYLFPKIGQWAMSNHSMSSVINQSNSPKKKKIKVEG
jgi:hypothetical protein